MKPECNRRASTDIKSVSIINLDAIITIEVNLSHFNGGLALGRNVCISFDFI